MARHEFPVSMDDSAAWCEENPGAASLKIERLRAENDDSRRAARKIIKAAKARMKGQSGDYVRGWRAALSEVDYLLKVDKSD